MNPRVFCLSVLLLAACASDRPHYQLTVGNGHHRLPLREVTVEVDGAATRSFQQIAPAKTAATRPQTGALPAVLRVAWTDFNGERHTATLTGFDRPSAFRGQLHVEIAADQTAKVSTIEQLETGASLMPWAAPENWEGSISFSGASSD